MSAQGSSRFERMTQAPWKLSEPLAPYSTACGNNCRVEPHADGAWAIGTDAHATEPYSFVIGTRANPTLITIRQSGEVLFGAGYDPTIAAREFWSALAYVPGPVTPPQIVHATAAHLAEAARAVVEHGASREAVTDLAAALHRYDSLHNR